MGLKFNPFTGKLDFTGSSSGGTVTSVTGGTGLTGGTITTSGTLAVSYGTTSGTSAQGNDSRLSDSRTPSGTAGGDLNGTYPNPTVDGLQGRPVSNATPVNGQVLQYDGANWVPGAIPTGGSGGGGVVYYLNFNTAADAPLTNIPQTPNTSKELGIVGDVTGTSYQSPILSTGSYDFLASFVTDVSTPSSTTIPAGLWDFNIFAQSTTTNSANQVYFKIEIRKYDGVNAPVLIATSNDTYIYDPAEIVQHVTSVVMPQTTILATDRIVIYLYGRANQNNNRITFSFGGQYPSHTHSTIPSVTGTGVVKVINGVFQSPASLIVNADVSPTAGIAVSKLSGTLPVANGGTGRTVGNYSIYANEIHVGKDGNDTTGDGTLINPVLTITKALTLVGAGRNTVIVHPGGYSESPTVTSTNTTIATSELTGANTELTGTLTLSAAARVSGLKMANLTITGSGNTYISNCTVDTRVIKSGSNYVEIINSELQCTSGVQITGAGTVSIVGNKCWSVAVSNAAASVLIKDCFQVITPSVTAGNLQFDGCAIFAAAPTTNAVTSSAGTNITLANSFVLNSVGSSVERVSLGGNYSILNLVYDKANSTLTGTNLNAVDYFSVINAEKIGVNTVADATVGLKLDSTGVKFNDGTIQTTAAAGVTSVTGISPIASSGGATPAISIANAAADGTTKGAAAFSASDFDATAGVVSIDYTNGQAASASTKGFLTSANWTTFNSKQATITTGAVDNAILRADGTGGSTLQNSDLNIDDATVTTQANVAITNQHSGQTNSAIVLTPKGTGAFILGPKPDGTTTGGNARGTRAVDLQINRSSSNRVASGNDSAIVAGANNTCNGTQSIVLAGEGNSCSGGYSVSGGFQSTAGGSFATSLGYINTTSANASGCFGGNNNQATQQSSGVLAGSTNQATGTYSGVIAGQSNQSSSTNAISFGTNALANRLSMQAHSAGQFAAQGDAQRARFVLRCKTTTNTAVEMALDGGSTYLTIPSGKYLTGTINIAGIKSDGSATASYIRQFSIKNVAATTTLVGTVNTIGIDTASLTSISITANDASDFLSVQVTGILSETWRWVASVDVVEVAYGT